MSRQSEREKLAMEVQAEALRPTPPLPGNSLQERLDAAARRILELEERVNLLQRLKRENQEQFRREVATQRRGLGIQDL